MSRKSHVWSKEEKEYLTKIVVGKSYKEICSLMNMKFEYQFAIGQIKGAIRRYKLNTGRTGRFEKGTTPANKGTKGISKPNKTSFHKGQVPANRKPVGSERINVEGYIEIKIAEPNKWKFKQRVVWEEHNGKLPKGHQVIFADGNKNNLDIDNLVLTSRQQLLVLNKNKLIKQDAELTKVGINIANIILKTHEIKNRK